MLQRVSQQLRTQSTREETFPAPQKGWIQSGNVITAPKDGAEVLDNFRPTAQGATFRAGCTQYAYVIDPVRRLFVYSQGGADELFSASDIGVYNADRMAATSPAPNLPV